MSELQEQITQLAAAFAEDENALGELLAAIAADVARGMAEPLEIFPVAHHSPSSALHLVARLQHTPPKVIYMEGCEDMLPIVENLRDCKLPVALQAFAAESADFEADKLPLSIVAPLTESSAEYQAIAYCLQNPETEIVFVDRPTDYAILWDSRQKVAQPDADEAAPAAENERLHGEAHGVQVGDLMPTFDTFLELLLKNSRTRHFSEWWDQYVEAAILGADYQTYREVMLLIGSLIRRLGRKEQHVAEDRLRERHMWTRMKQHMAANGIRPNEALHICGAAHTATDVVEFGTDNDLIWEIPERTDTNWLYGLLPSSFAAIEHQFGHPRGSVQLADAAWQKGLKARKLRAFTIQKGKKQPRKRKNAKGKSTSSDNATLTVTEFLTRPPVMQAADEEQLLNWCVRIVALARKNGYLASTADSIAIFQTSQLLANLRDRAHPTPYDFTDAAITCLEKSRTPKKRNINQLCGILLGGDRIGTVGYASLPPLAQNAYDRLAPLGVNLLAKTNQRALIDYRDRPELLPCSDVLWRIHFLCGKHVVTPIMGERTLGHAPLQESWEIRIGKYQGSLIQLGYAGVTIEQVLAQRLQKVAFADDATASAALESAENSLLYLDNARLSAELGTRAIDLLKDETGAADAPAIFKRIRRLVHYFRSTPDGLPEWVEAFVTTGYAHYATLLPIAFADQGTSPEQVAAMLSFIFTLESLALSLGCSRSQLVIAIEQIDADKIDPAKAGLLWTAEWLLQLRTLDEIRAFFDEVLSNSLRINAFPAYLSGFMLSLGFAKQIGRFLVELVSKVFATVPDHILMPWLPTLIIQLRSQQQVVQTLIKEAAFTFPASLEQFDGWVPPWEAVVGETVSAETMPMLTESDAAIRDLLFAHRNSAESFTDLLGIEHTG